MIHYAVTCNESTEPMATWVANHQPHQSKDACMQILRDEVKQFIWSSNPVIRVRAFGMGEWTSAGTIIVMESQVGVIRDVTDEYLREWNGRKA